MRSSLGVRPKPEPSGQQSSFQRKDLGASKIAQYVKVIAAKPDDLSSIPGIHMVEGIMRKKKKKQLLQVVL